MSSDTATLERLRERIAATWALLRIEDKKTQLQATEREMQQADFWRDQTRAAQVGKDHEAARKEVEEWSRLREEVDELILLAGDLEKVPDAGIKAELEAHTQGLETKFQTLEFYLLLSGDHDVKNAIVAVHAGSGGTEAQDWAEMLRRMILRYAEKKGWAATILDESRGAEAGIKSSMLRIAGRYAYGHLQSEHGTHRLVRISPFDAEKMRHTSFALIEVIPEMESESIAIDPKDLRVDTFMAGGHGGQSVNTTYSAVRIVHLPTGITVQCQNERSQQQNKDTAMKILHSKLQKLKEEEEERERQELRGEYKSAEWGNQIRSYVLHPYKLVKDVRTKYETADPEAVLNGELDSFVEAYLRWRRSHKS